MLQFTRIENFRSLFISSILRVPYYIQLGEDMATYKWE